MSKAGYEMSNIQLMPSQSVCNVHNYSLEILLKANSIYSANYPAIKGLN